MERTNLTFRGGVHPLGNKDVSNRIPIADAKLPAEVRISMHQHIGAPCEPTVNVGDVVKVGQVIGQSEAFVSAVIHASIAGTVKEISEIVTANGNVKAVVIEGDGSEEKAYIEEINSLESFTPEEIIAKIKNAGITGLGGASFPAHVKISPPADKPIDTVIINGAECEPYLTADQLQMEEAPEKVVKALQALMKALSASKGYIAIEDNKPNAIGKIKEAANGTDIDVAVFKTKYPQGDEKRIIDALLDRQVPAGGLPLDVGVVVQNVSTAIAMYDAVYLGKPLYERVITVTGDAVKSPCNIRVRLGTPIEEVIDQAGGFMKTPGKIIAGGPMMGIAQPSLHMYTLKGMGGLLCLSEEAAKLPKPTNCINCGRCVDACPVHLQPVNIAKYTERQNFEMAAKYHALDCVECGACSFICPAKRPLVENIRLAKREIRAKEKRA